MDTVDTGHTVDTPPGSDPATGSSQRQCYCSEEICQQPPALASLATAEPHRTVFAGAVRGDWARHCSSSSLRNLDIWPPPPRLLCNNTDHYTADIYLTYTITITLNTHSSVSTVSTHGSTNDNHFS